MSLSACAILPAQLTANWTCSNGTWLAPPSTTVTLGVTTTAASITFTGDVTLSAPFSAFGSNITVGQSLVILSSLNLASSTVSVGADLTLSGGATLQLSGPTNRLTVSGCVNLQGTIVLANATEMSAQPIVTYACSSNGTAPTIVAQSASSDCAHTPMVSSTVGQNQLIVTLNFVNACSSPPEGLAPSQLLAIEVVVPIVVVLIIVAIVLAVVPATRRKLFPFTDRPHYVPSHLSRSATGGGA